MDKDTVQDDHHLHSDRYTGEIRGQSGEDVLPAEVISDNGFLLVDLVSEGDPEVADLQIVDLSREEQIEQRPHLF